MVLLVFHPGLQASEYSSHLGACCQDGCLGGLAAEVFSTAFGFRQILKASTYMLFSVTGRVFAVLQSTKSRKVRSTRYLKGEMISSSFLQSRTAFNKTTREWHKRTLSLCPMVLIFWSISSFVKFHNCINLMTKMTSSNLLVLLDIINVVEVFGFSLGIQDNLSANMFDQYRTG